MTPVASSKLATNNPAMEIERPLNSLAATELFAKDLAGLLCPGDVVALDGVLGAGKTTLVRFLAKALGIAPDSVSSPTFVLLHRYEREGKPDLVHIDAYRLAPEELDTLGLDAIEDGAIVVIEWAERLGDALAQEALRIELRHVDEDARSAHIRVHESWQDRPGLGSLEPRADTICPTTGERVPGESPTWPFANERARMADLGRWFDERYEITRPIEQRDIELGD